MNVCDEFLAGSNLNGLYNYYSKRKKYINAGATIYLYDPPRNTCSKQKNSKNFFWNKKKRVPYKKIYSLLNISPKIY